MEEFSEQGIRIGSLFHRKGAVKGKGLIVIRREEGLDGRLRETTDEDLVFVLF